MIRNPVTLLVLALAMLLAPQGVCMGWGHVQAAMAAPDAHHSAGMHHGQPQGHGHAGHEESGKHHFCADCQAPEFTGPGKAAADPGSFPAAASAIMPAAVRIPAAWDGALPHRWLGRAPPIPPPAPKSTKVRLQI